MSSKNQGETATTPGPVPLPPPDRRASFSQNPSFSTLFGRGSPPRPTADPTLQRRFSWSFAPPKESSSAIDDSDDIAASPSDDGSSRRGSETIGRRLSTTAMSLREALGFKPIDDPTSPGTLKTNPFHQSKSDAMPPASASTEAGQLGAQSFMQRRRASFGKPRKEADPHADRMLQGQISVD